jgi:hypothetical protein
VQELIESKAVLKASQSKPPRQERGHSSRRSGDSSLCKNLDPGRLFEAERLTIKRPRCVRPIGMFAAGGVKAYTVDHRPIWRRGAAPPRVSHLGPAVAPTGARGSFLLPYPGLTPGATRRRTLQGEDGRCIGGSPKPIAVRQTSSPSTLNPSASLRNP